MLLSIVYGVYNSYQLIKPLKSGGEKVVYLAVCIANHREVVIKFLKSYKSKSARHRFRLEITSMIKAGSKAGDRLAAILDFNLEDPIVFYVEEYFKYGSLAETMKTIFDSGKTFNPKFALDYCRQILLGLHAIHTSNQIHRDIKPPNIMFRALHQLVIIDMGLGRTLDRPCVNQTKAFCGTHGYAAPEQELAGALPVDVRSDLYAVGVILHEMLTGQKGHWASLSYSENRYIRQLLHKLLSFSANNRYSSAQEVIRVIDFILYNRGELGI